MTAIPSFSTASNGLFRLRHLPSRWLKKAGAKYALICDVDTMKKYDQHVIITMYRHKQRHIPKDYILVRSKYEEPLRLTMQRWALCMDTNTTLLPYKLDI